MIEVSLDREIELSADNVLLVNYDVTCDWCTDGMAKIAAEDRPSLVFKLEDEGWKNVPSSDGPLQKCPDCVEE